MSAAADIPRWPAGLPVAAGVLALGLLLGGLGWWGVSAQLAGAVVTSGLVTVESNRQAGQHPEGGVVGHPAAAGHGAHEEDADPPGDPGAQHAPAHVGVPAMPVVLIDVEVVEPRAGLAVVGQHLVGDGPAPARRRPGDHDRVHEPGAVRDVGILEEGAVVLERRIVGDELLTLQAAGGVDRPRQESLIFGKQTGNEVI